MKAFAIAHRLLFQHGFWRYLLFPVSFSVALVPLALWGGFEGFAALAQWVLGWFMDDGTTAASIVGTVLLIATLVLLAGPLFLVFRGLVMLAYLPFLDRLAEKAERVVEGGPTTLARGLLSALWRWAAMFAITLAASAAVLVAGFLLGLVPLVGVVISTVFVAALQLWLGSVANVDPYLDRRGYSTRGALGLMWRFFFTLTVFGGLSLGATAVPVVGWFVGPTYTAVAGVVLGLLIDEIEAPNAPGRHLSG